MKLRQQRKTLTSTTRQHQQRTMAEEDVTRENGDVALSESEDVPSDGDKDGKTLLDHAAHVLSSKVRPILEQRKEKETDNNATEEDVAITTAIEGLYIASQLLLKVERRRARAHGVHKAKAGLSHTQQVEYNIIRATSTQTSFELMHKNSNYCKNLNKRKGGPSTQKASKRPKKDTPKLIGENTTFNFDKVDLEDSEFKLTSDRINFCKAFPQDELKAFYGFLNKSERVQAFSALKKSCYSENLLAFLKKLCGEIPLP